MTATGQITAAEMVVSRATNPQITFTDTDNTPDYRIRNNDGVLEIIKASNAAVRLAINTDGHVDINDHLDVTGEINTTQLNLTDTKPKILFTESDSNPDYRIVLNAGNLGIEDTTNSNAARFVVNSDGHVDVPGNLDVGAGLDLTGDLIISSTAPKIELVDTDSNSDFQIKNENGQFRIRDLTHSINRLTIASDGTADVTGNLNVGAGLDVTGNITVSGTVDGVDVATLATESFATAIAVALG